MPVPDGSPHDPTRPTENRFSVTSFDPARPGHCMSEPFGGPGGVYRVVATAEKRWFEQRLPVGDGPPEWRAMADDAVPAWAHKVAAGWGWPAPAGRADRLAALVEAVRQLRNACELDDLAEKLHLDLGVGRELRALGEKLAGCFEDDLALLARRAALREPSDPVPYDPAPLTTAERDALREKLTARDAATCDALVVPDEWQARGWTLLAIPHDPALEMLAIEYAGPTPTHGNRVAFPAQARRLAVAVGEKLIAEGDRVARLEAVVVAAGRLRAATGIHGVEALIVPALLDVDVQLEAEDLAEALKQFDDDEIATLRARVQARARGADVPPVEGA